MHAAALAHLTLALDDLSPARTALAMVGATVLLVGGVIGLYLVKSALGINLFPGPSPLHGLYVALLR